MSRPGQRPPDTTGLLRRAVPVVWLVIVWVLLWGTFSWANVLGGLAIGLLVLVVFPMPPAPGGGWVRPWAALVALGRFARDLVVSSLQVAWQSLQAATGTTIRSSVVAVRLASSSEFVMAMLVEMLTLVPGSVVIEARPEERMIYAHVLGADDDEAVAAFRAQVARLEADIVAALGRPAAPVRTGETT